ncbi:hypothetical protein CY34DRAFT_807801 [Suillus luteus UH-Slu-Lm8-n1]|uniref:Uncharacterized protein n=1 Tax=Suillus luteus UH-Slu-Lm8-n1 TaxID=930992 RepID=A0A0C9ZQ64_9AGAM|nr:hypothetical protein CY34DRAFT_807801 [Suillus luteus UH-Slu-Lm8-n1]
MSELRETAPTKKTAGHRAKVSKLRFRSSYREPKNASKTSQVEPRTAKCGSVMWHDN